MSVVKDRQTYRQTEKNFLKFSKLTKHVKPGFEFFKQFVVLRETFNVHMLLTRLMINVRTRETVCNVSFLVVGLSLLEGLFKRVVQWMCSLAFCFIVKMLWSCSRNTATTGCYCCCGCRDGVGVWCVFFVVDVQQALVVYNSFLLNFLYFIVVF